MPGCAVVGRRVLKFCIAWSTDGAMRGPAFFAYANNYLIDVKIGVIMNVEASRAIRQAEVGAAKTMIERRAGWSIMKRCA